MIIEGFSEAEKVPGHDLSALQSKCHVLKTNIHKPTIMAFPDFSTFEERIF